jgi:hypothetical protein
MSARPDLFNTFSREARDLIHRTKSARFSVFKDSILRTPYTVGLFRRFSPSQTKSVLKSSRVWAPIVLTNLIYLTRQCHQKLTKVKN